MVLYKNVFVWWRRAWQVRRLLISAAVSVLVFLLISIGTWAILADRGQHDPVDRAALLGVVAGAVAALAALLVVPTPKAELSLGELAEEARKLAGRLLEDEGNELDRLKGVAGQHIDVGFTLVPVPTRMALGAGGTGHFDDILGYYRALLPQRLVIIGKPGSGKSVLALELVVRLLNERRGQRGDGPLPVRFSLSRWDGESAIGEWLVGDLMGVHRLSLAAAEGLVRNGLIIPVFDGLDEVDPVGAAPIRAARIVAKLGVWSRGGSPAPLVLTCRDELYLSLPGHPGSAGLDGTRLVDAATVKVSELTSKQVVDYIGRRVIDPDRWQLVLERLSDDGSSTLLYYLNTPWRLMLAVSVYEGDHAQSPAELVEDPVDLDERLLPSYVRTVTAPPSAKRPPRYRPDKAQAWLSWLAAYLSENTQTGRIVGGRTLSGTDLVLHQLWPIAGERAARNVDTAIAAVMSAPGLAWLGIFAFAHPMPWKVSYFLVVAGYYAALWRTSRAYWIEPHSLDPRQLLSMRGIGLLLVAAGCGCFAALIFNPPAGAVIGFGAWIAGGLSLTPVQALVRRELPSTTPRSPLRGDLGMSVAAGLSVAPAAGLAFSLTVGKPAGWVIGIAYALVVGLTVAQAPWRRYLALLLTTRGKLPWRLGAFMDWSYKAGLLRISGIAYQFRHDELRGWLARHRADKS
jgi:hypothetical protein